MLRFFIKFIKRSIIIRRNLDLEILKRPQYNLDRESKNPQSETLLPSKKLSDAEISARLNTLTNDFMNGNISAKDAANILLDLGISSIYNVDNNITTLEFEYNGKRYKITSNSLPIDDTVQKNQKTTPSTEDFLNPETVIIPPSLENPAWEETLPLITPDRNRNFPLNPEIIPLIKTEKTPSLDSNNKYDLPSPDEIPDLKTFMEILSSGKFNKTIDKETADKYLNKMLECHKKDLEKNGIYSDKYINAILECSKENIDINSDTNNVNLQEYLNLCYENTTKILQPTDLHYVIKIFETEIDTFDEISAENLFYIINDKCVESDDIQVKFFGKIFGDLIKDKNFSFEEQKRFFKKLFIELGANLNEYGEISFTREDFKNFDTNNDKNWMAELYDIAQDKTQEITILTDNEIKNAKTLELNILFGEDSELDAKNLLAKIETLAKSEDAGSVKLAQLLNETLGKNFCVTDEEKEAFLKAFIVIYNKTYNPSNPNKNSLQKNEFVAGNNNGLLLNQITEILASDTVANLSKVINANEEIEEFSQGTIGDCWLLSGLKALASNPIGQEILKEQIKWADDYSEVTIYFAGANKYITITLDEIVKAKNSENNGGKDFSSGDIDVMIMELAMIKVMGGNIEDIDSDQSSTFWKNFLKNAQINSDTASGIDDLFNAVGNFFGAGGKADLNSGSVKKILKNLYSQKLKGENIVATFSLGTFGDSSYYCTTIEGEKVLLYSTKADWLDYSGHTFAITEITADTVTFVNPHNTKKTYTVSWKEFANMHIKQIQSVKFNAPQVAEKNEFSFRGEVYNINEILSSTKPTFIKLTPKTKNYDKAAKDAINKIEILIASIKENLIGYDTNKIDKACETILNYYKAALKAGTVRSKNGTVGNNFSYHDLVNNKIINCSDRSDMRSAFDHKDVNSAEEIYKKSKKGDTGIYIGHDKEGGGGYGNDNFYIYLDVQELLNRLMNLLK